MQLQIQQQGYPVDMTPAVPPPTGPMRGSFRGRGGAPSRPFGGGVPLGPAASRGSAALPMGMGRGRFGADGPPQMLPKRPASPLPPNVPTGPRNQQTRYKDRDGGSAQVDGLDYGGGGGGGGGSSTGGGAEAEERERKRDKTPPLGPRKDKEKEERERRTRDEKRPSRDERHRDPTEEKPSRKRTHSEDYEYEREARSSKRR